MTLFTDQHVQIDDLLDKMAEELELGETRWKRMESSYNEVSDWLKGDDGYFQQTEFEIYPQGSVKIGTAIKPWKGDEFDLDVVVHLKDFDPALLPLIVFTRLKRRLAEHGYYKTILESKNRCIRLNFKNDYHMDVLPGCQISEFNRNQIRIPDRALDMWVFSNPRGFAKWFLDQTNLARETLLEKAYAELRQEQITRATFMNKPLQRAVQLMKWYRDRYFDGRDYATSSIVLTTLFGLNYSGEGSIFETIENTLEKIHAHVVQNPFTRIEVRNPVDTNEDFTDKWKQEPEYYQAFKGFAVHVYGEWQKLKTGQGMVGESKILKGLFGDDLYGRGIKRQAGLVNDMRGSQLLGTSNSTGNLSSIILPAVTPTKRNTFFGK
ncbi:MAG: hypothetical protein GC192_21400 [Bacteroidetes bacterium]|nr:hypothetical protein [Bacteroidota bacterium]